MNLSLHTSEKHNSIKIHGLTKYKIGILNMNNAIEIGVLIFP